MVVSLVETEQYEPRAVRRATAVRVKPGDRVLIITLLPGGQMIEFRPKGTRQRYRVAIRDCMDLAVRNKVIEEQRARAQRKRR
jgi:hypothetical protein